jgi:hypothetical protein
MRTYADNAGTGPAASMPGNRRCLAMGLVSFARTATTATSGRANETQNHPPVNG